ncbi:MAG: group II intron maturase-specific domain-containing protein [Candidatus Aadella gelida]|nr:group II intron maturase-specific domain-containing protein [Candidatus Aadella gelida]
MEYPRRKFDFLGYTFRSRRVKSGKGEYFVGFNPAVSNDAKKLLRKKVKNLVVRYRSKAKLEDLSKIINSVLRGWVNYYGKYRRTEILFTLYGVNETLVWWARKKYKRLKASHGKAYRWVGRIAKHEPNLFAHWSMGCGPVTE